MLLKRELQFFLLAISGVSRNCCCCCCLLSVLCSSFSSMGSLSCFSSTESSSSSPSWSEESDPCGLSMEFALRIIFLRAILACTPEEDGPLEFFLTARREELGVAAPPLLRLPSSSRELCWLRDLRGASGTDRRAGGGAFCKVAKSPFSKLAELGRWLASPLSCSGSAI